MYNMKSIGFSQYCITKDGRIYSLKINRWVKQQVSNNGYFVVSMGADNGTRYRKKVHRLLLQVFDPIENCEDFVVNHIDGDKTNNDLKNLEWCTIAENSRHAADNGLYKPSCVNDHTKFPEDFEILEIDEDDYISSRKSLDVEKLHEIFQKMQDGYRACDISKMFGIKRYTISALVNNPSKEIEEVLKLYDLSNKYKKSMLSVDSVILVCEMLSTGRSATSVAKELGISERVVMDIKARRSYLTISSTYTW